MEECGVGRPLNQWFREYLTARSYRVKVADTLSAEQRVRSGVPQGSGCGPLCYLMHVNSLCGALNYSSAYMFADDLCTLRAGFNLTDTCYSIQNDIDAVVRWSHDNGIVLNADKTKLLILHSPHLNLNESPPPLVTHSYSCLHNNLVNCQCKPIERVDCVTYLGVKIDNNFSWSQHIEYISDKLRILLGKFYHLSYKVPISTLKCLYFALVDSILDYALDCYGLTFKTYLDKLETLQTRFLKLLVNTKTKLECRDNYKKLYKICKILPVTVKFKYLLAIHNYKTCNNYLHPITHKHGTRSISEGKFEVPKVNNYYGDRTLKKRIPYLLNSLPQDIRQEPMLSKFKTKLKKYFLLNLP
ncbi:hypothetical protein JYU34_014455 [Plutella xylostella]|uniref:Reverse transcriptase domain-containing protein n=1 Tax=Plutella xylostella TaxID=51655 RepID=A0ABQ7Q9T7_PLUXY|nr:hypothetical protein JYU34_014455 [Plutella xylostella]